MPATYTPITTQTISGSSTASITLSSIPSTYTDLVLVSNLVTSDGLTTTYAQFNGDTATNYSFAYTYGNGTSALTARSANVTAVPTGFYVTPNTAFGNVSILNIMNYSNTTTYKSTLGRASSAIATYPGAEMNAGLWRSTAAISSIRLYISQGYWIAGSTFTLYGIKSA